MSEGPEPVWKELTVPSEEDRRLFEEWKRRQEEIETHERDDDRVVIIDV